jgi:hypothetical protein
MTEAEWLATTDPHVLTHYKGCRSRRKRRLFSCAVARRVLYLIPDDRYERAIEIAERYADGVAAEKERRATHQVMHKAWQDREYAEAGNHAATAVLATLNKGAAGTLYSWEVAAAAKAALARPEWDRGREEEMQKQCDLAREIYGNPFRPVTADPSWLTSTVVALAEGIYADRAFDRLLILADALQDAGCENADILDHCRCDGTHVRGCWVVDLVLGKA